MNECVECRKKAAMPHSSLCASCDAANRKKKEKERLKAATISDCVLGILEGLKIDQKQLDVILDEISNSYGSWFLDWVRDNVSVSGSITDLSLEWK